MHRRHVRRGRRIRFRYRGHIRLVRAMFRRRVCVVVRWAGSVGG